MTKYILSAQEMKIHFQALNIKKILYTFSSNSDIRWQTSFANIKIHTIKTLMYSVSSAACFQIKNYKK